MTQTWGCTDARTSLGVYVLGAIDPAERALVDAHLLTCRDCRDELAGLAGLPALLARVNPDEISRICADDTVRTVTEDRGRLRIYLGYAPGAGTTCALLSEGRRRDGHDLAAFAGDRQGPVAPFQAQVLDVGAGGLGDP